MKKILPIVLAAVLALSAAGCAAQSQTPETTTEMQMAGMQNPMKAVDSLEALNALVHGNLTHPPVMGVTDESFYTIDNGDALIGEYNFSVNGVVCTMRFVDNTTEDISGIYKDGKPLFATSEDTHAVTEEYTVERWFTIDGQYVFMAKNAGLPEGWFENAVEELKSLTFTGDGDVDADADHYTYSDLDGDWQDSVSGRASATIKAQEDSVEITVSWAESAMVTDVWTMHATIAEDGKLVYTDCKYTKDDYTNDENGVETVVYENGKGYFEFTDGKLRWTGAADEFCKTCAFEKM